MASSSHVPRLKDVAAKANVSLSAASRILRGERQRFGEETCDRVLEAAREQQGLERLDQIRYAVLERSGKISIVPR